jgi:hypothetical protein
MREATPKGSIIYKLLIVLLSVALIATILYPRSLWKQENARTDECRQKMEHILYAEYVYLSENNAFNDTLSRVVDFIKGDTTGMLLKTFANTDSILALEIIDHLKNDDLANTIIDTLLRLSKRLDIDTTEAMILDSLRDYPEYSRAIDSIAIANLDNFFTCPTVGDSYIVHVNNDSAIKLVTLISCPIDEEDSLTVSRDFKLSKLGGLKIMNHGQIVNGERKW